MQQQLQHKETAHIQKTVLTDAKTAGSLAIAKQKADQQADLAAASASKGDE